MAARTRKHGGQHLVTCAENKGHTLEGDLALNFVTFLSHIGGSRLFSIISYHVRASRERCNLILLVKNLIFLHNKQVSDDIYDVKHNAIHTP